MLIKDRYNTHCLALPWWSLFWCSVLMLPVVRIQNYKRSLGFMLPLYDAQSLCVLYSIIRCIKEFNGLFSLGTPLLPLNLLCETVYTSPREKTGYRHTGVGRARGVQQYDLPRARGGLLSRYIVAMTVRDGIVERATYPDHKHGIYHAPQTFAL